MCLLLFVVMLPPNRDSCFSFCVCVSSVVSMYLACLVHANSMKLSNLFVVVIFLR